MRTLFRTALVLGLLSTPALAGDKKDAPAPTKAADAKAPAADAWYADHKASIDGKKADYLKKWNVMLPADKAELTLKAEDGV